MYHMQEASMKGLVSLKKKKKKKVKPVVLVTIIKGSQ